MHPPETDSVCVVIPAKNAAETIGRAIASALREPEVSEVLVVDDGSSDDTATVSRAVGHGTDRLRVLRLETNHGPAFARNHAIDNSHAPLIAILDADDFFLPGRFTHLLESGDWDFIADNIVFVDQQQVVNGEPRIRQFAPNPYFLDLPGFIEGNISKRGAPRGEIGFLKPVMRRSFLDRQGLRYRTDLRLGEDYELYVRALASGARYKIIRSCGYGAVTRSDSLSGRHKTIDLKRLYEADRALLTLPQLTQKSITALRRHERHVRARYELREFLDVKARSGIAAAAIHAISRPTALAAIIGGVVGDKMEARRNSAVSKREHSQPEGYRYLLPATASVRKPKSIPENTKHRPDGA